MTPNDSLVTAVDFANHVQIAEHVPFDSHMKPHVLNAQLMDILPVIGNALFVDLVNNETASKYVELLDGGTYTDTSGNTLVFMGLKKAICLFAFSRWCFEANINASAFGLVVKTTGQSEPVDAKTAALRANREREKAVAALESCIDFITAKGASVYPIYFNSGSTTTTPPSRSGMKIRSASRLDNNR